jgi:predicted Fe-Mo cluster-binding NifX family protein
MDSRFGRANFFAIVDTENMEARFIENSAASADSGAGVGAAQLFADQNVAAVISGDFGPKAFIALKTAGIELYSYRGSTIREAVEAYKNGELRELGVSSNNGHAGFRQV